jgi:hypothetical protein
MCCACRDGWSGSLGASADRSGEHDRVLQCGVVQCGAVWCSAVSASAGVGGGGVVKMLLDRNVDGRRKKMRARRHKAGAGALWPWPAAWSRTSDAIDILRSPALVRAGLGIGALARNGCAF